MTENQKKVAVRVEHLTKSFKIPLESSSGVKQRLINIFKGRKGYRIFTPLNDVSFEIEKGDFFGIVGRNGSGKSTLLKSIAGIYTIGSGKLSVDGTLVPFIELGVGFNIELTGRENVYLNGALLGFSNKEMDEMYDEIVDFAELHDFMEERIKNYSSGMQVRLAFSIAIKAEGDILLLDEVLAVGDQAFQKKCFDYFEELKRKKKTVILVSHDMNSVMRFCTRAIMIEDGEIKVMGTPEDVAKQYILNNMSVSDRKKDGAHEKRGMSLSGDVVKSIKIIPKSSHVMERDDVLEFDVEYTYRGKVDDLYLGISILYRGVPVIEHGVIDEKPYKDTGSKTIYRYRLPLNRFTQGNFTVTAALLGREEKNLVAFTTGEGSFNFELTKKGKPRGGLLLERGEWIEA